MFFFSALAQKIKQKVVDRKNISLLKESAYFDAKYYLSTYEDVVQSGIPPEHHYYYCGWREGRNPNHIFKSHEYLEDNQDVKAGGVCPLLHFMEYGKGEQRPMARNLDFVEYKDVKILDCNKKMPVTTLKVCAIFYIYYEDLTSWILPYMNNLPSFVDIYIASDQDEKILRIKNDFEKNGIKNKTTYVQVGKDGRDTGALLVGHNKIVRQYDLFCYLHGKKSPQVSWGGQWRTFIFNNLLGCRQGIEEIINSFEKDKSLGLVYTPIYPTFLNADNWDVSNNKSGLEKLLRKKINYKYDITIADSFPSSGMFWARTNAILDVFNMNFAYEDFKESHGKIDGTLGHFIERSWGIVAQKNGYTAQKILMPYNKITAHEPAPPLKKRLVLFLCTKLNENVLYSCKELLKIAEKVIIIVNTDVGADTAAFEKYCTVLLRENIGLDFGAWRDALNYMGYDELSRYDELILCNDTCWFPVFSMENMFADMASVNCDFWGSTIHPPKRGFQEHVQSYFFCFKRNVFMSYTFRNFFLSVENLSYTDRQEVIYRYENTLTQKLAQAGFKYNAHTDFDAPLFPFSSVYHPLAFLLVGNNFIKKKSLDLIRGHENTFIDFVKDLSDFDIDEQLNGHFSFAKRGTNKLLPTQVSSCRPSAKKGSA